jgi:SAM-dependent methyltransferase
MMLAQKNDSAEADSWRYQGTELDNFAAATNWTRFLTKKFKKFVKGDVLEVGAGLGTMSNMLMSSETRSWTFVEPDEVMFQRLKTLKWQIPTQFFHGTLDQVEATSQFDTILYIDVLEHIEDDLAEVKKAYQRLRKGGVLILSCPAFQFLYNDFDRGVGHFRRYRKNDFQKLADAALPGSRNHILRYVDPMGFLLQLTNKLFLKTKHPKRSQILLWDQVFVPISRVVDPLTQFIAGKTVLGVWEKL